MPLLEVKPRAIASRLPFSQVRFSRNTPAMVDRKSGRPLATPAFRSAAGPAADAPTRRKYSVLAGERATAKDSTSAK